MSKKENIKKMIEKSLESIVNHTLQEINKIVKAIAHEAKKEDESLEMVINIMSNATANIIRALSMPGIDENKELAHDREAALIAMYLIYVDKILMLSHNMIYHEANSEDKCDRMN